MTHDQERTIDGLFTGPYSTWEAEAKALRQQVAALQAEAREMALQIISSDGQAGDALGRAVRAEADLAAARELIALLEGEQARADALQASNARLRKAEKDAIATLDAWFDRRKLAHDAVDQAVLDAARGYLRTSRVGGMSQQESDLVEGVISDMAHRSVFADIFARAALAQERGE